MHPPLPALSLGERIKGEGVIAFFRLKKYIFWHRRMGMKYLLIKNGLVIDPSREIEAVSDVLVKDGRILACAKNLKTPSAGCHVCDAAGKWVMPGVIDMHVHLRQPGAENSETVKTGSRAAAAGGVCTLCAMPNTDPPADSPAMILRMKNIARSESVVNALFSGCVTKGRSGVIIADMEAMAKAGACAFTDDGSPVSDQRIFLKALEASAALGIPLIEHCEDLSLSAGGVINKGKISKLKKLPGIARQSEILSSAKNIALAAAVPGSRLHIAHVSCAETVEYIRTAKKAGINITAETCPHYFCLTEEDISGRDADFKMNPPLRTKRDVIAILRGLADGTIDAVASDHAPHHARLKAKGMLKAPFGIIGLETLLPLVMTKLVHGKIISASGMARLLSVNPAKILRLKSKGGLKPGMDADITIINPLERFTAGKFLSKSKNSPFTGMKLTGRSCCCIVAGKFVMKDGVIL